MSGVLAKKFGRKYSGSSPAVSSRHVLGQLRLRVPPGEVGVRLAEPGLGERRHQRGAGERLRQEHDVRDGRLHLADQPLPERDRLRVRVVDAEDPDALAAQQSDDVPQRLPEPRQSSDSKLRL